MQSSKGRNMKFRGLVLTGLAGLGIWQFFRQRERNSSVSLRNKVVIITGASSGIGRASARIFAAQGAHTVLVARRANILAEVQSELQDEFDSRVLTVAGDVTQQADINNVVRTALDEFGRIDVLVNNAGIARGGYLEEKDFENWKDIIDVNLNGAMNMTQAVLPLMKAQRSGHIVNVSSVITFNATPGQAVYVASKSGINGFSDALRREVFPHNVNVSVVMPGFTETPMTEGVREKLADSDMPSDSIAIEGAEYVASNIVAAVRYKRSRVVLGGMQMLLADIAYRISPSILDLLYTRIVDPEKLVEATTGD